MVLAEKFQANLILKLLEKLLKLDKLLNVSFEIRSVIYGSNTL